MTEEDTFNKLRGVPFIQVYKEYQNWIGMGNLDSETERLKEFLAIFGWSLGGFRDFQIELACGRLKP